MIKFYLRVFRKNSNLSVFIQMNAQKDKLVKYVFKYVSKNMYVRISNVIIIFIKSNRNLDRLFT